MIPCRPRTAQPRALAHQATKVARAAPATREEAPSAPRAQGALGTATVLSALWAIGALLTLGACDADQGRAPRTLVVAQASAIQGLDPAQMTDAESIDLLEQIFEHLVRYAPESMKVEPALATSWEQQADGRTWRFFLRHGVRFHDGTPLTADAVVYSFQRQRTSTPGTETHFPYVNHYRNIVAIEKESSHVVRIVTDRPFAPLLASLAMFPVSIVSPKAFGAAQRGAPLSPVGTGPYKFVSWDRQTGRILLEANRSYWGPRPGMDRLVFVPIPSAAERLSALQSGLVHIARNLPPDMLQLVRLHPDLRLVEAPANNVVYLAMNTERRPFHDPRVRQAVNHAFRKEPFLGLVFQGMASPAVGPLPPSMTPYYTADVQRYDYDPKRARRLLQEAGYDPSLRPKLLVMDAPRSYLPQPRLAASMILRDLQAIGMQIDLQILPFSEQKRQLSLGVHDLGLIGWTGDNGDPDNFLYTLLDSDNAAYGSGLNYAFYREYTFHKLVIAARESLSQAERVRYYHEAQRIAAITCPWVPIGHAKVAVAMRREVRGFRVHPTSVLYLHSVTLR